MQQNFQNCDNQTSSVPNMDLDNGIEILNGLQKNESSAGRMKRREEPPWLDFNELKLN